MSPRERGLLFLAVALVALAVLIFLTNGCATAPASPNLRWAQDLRSGDFAKRFCLSSENFSAAIVAGCLEQQPPQTDDHAWANRCLREADLGDTMLEGDFRHRSIGVADCLL